LWVIQAEPLRAAGRGSFINRLIELAGGENAMGQTAAKYPFLPTESLLSADPEVIIQSSMGEDLAGQERSAREYFSKWEMLEAVKNNSIFVIESDTVLRLGPRLAEGIELVEEYIHRSVSEDDREE
jgi:iron complex transport system substrate-binding protein